MTFEVHKSKLVTINPGQPGFLLQDGLTISPRAGFELSTNCPREYKLILAECINKGWIKPVATIYKHEQTFNLLKGN
jgi:hypothetical protein